MIRNFLFIIGVLGIFSCTKIIEDPVFDTTPRIELVGLSTNQVVEFQDSLIVTIRYEDGDGDLGDENPDVNSIFIKDARLEEADGYYLAPLAPAGASISITGELDIILFTPFILGNGASESTQFSIYVVDRSGNQSNTIETESIQIIR